MKKNSTKYVLIGALILIWGIIGYNVFNTLKPPLPAISIVQFDSPKEDVKQREVYQLVLGYDDPFLKKKFSRERKVIVSKNTTSATPIKKVVKPKSVVKEVRPIPLKWPDISYYGSIKRTNSQVSLFLLNIDGTVYYIENGSQIKDIEVIRVSSDSVVVELMGKEKRTFKKSS